MRRGKSVVFASMCIFCYTSMVCAIKVKSMADSAITGADLVQKILGDGILVNQSSITFNGSPVQAGLFTDATVEGQGNALLTQGGIVLGTGKVNSLNSNLNTSASIGELSQTSVGDADLSNLVGYPTVDASVLEFDFVVTGEGTVSAELAYVFGSEEYNDFVGSDFIDAFALFLDGQNIATVPGTTQPVSINTVNAGSNPSLFNNNQFNPSGSPFLSEMNGFTTPLTAQFSVQAGTTHHLKIAVANGTSPGWDSWVAIGGKSFVSKVVPEPSTVSLVLVGLGMLGMSLKKRTGRREIVG